jgi:hypothetical protein
MSHAPAAPRREDERGEAMRKLLALVLAAAAIAVVAGCGGDDSQATAEENACASVAELRSSLLAFTGFDVRTTTIDDLEEARDDVRAAFSDVADSARDVAQESAEDLDQALGELATAIDRLPADTTIPQAVREITPQVEAVITAARELANGLDCET